MKFYQVTKTEKTEFNGCVLAITLLLAGCATGSSIEPQQDVSPRTSMQTLRQTDTQPATEITNARDQLEALLNEEKLDAAVELAQHHAAHPSRLPSERSRLFGDIAYAAASRNKFEMYREYLELAIEADPATGHYISSTYVRWDHGGEQPVNSMVWLVQNKPDKLHRIKIRNMWAAYRSLRDAGREDDLLTFLRTLHDIDYDGWNEAISTEGLTLELIKLYLKRGQRQSAVALALSEINRSNILLELWHDRRFEPLWAPLEASDRFDVNTMMRNDIQHAYEVQTEALEGNWKGYLSATLELVLALKGAGSFEMAEAEAKRVLEMVPEPQRTLEDFAWLKNERAELLEELGSVDASLALMAEFATIDLKEQDHVISQQINYSSMLRNARRYTEAAAYAEDIVANKRAYMSEYGVYWAQAVKVCAYTGMRDLDLAKATYAELILEADINFSATTMAGLCLEEYDEIAALYITRLKDPVHRIGALIALSEYPLPDLTTENATLQFRLNRIRDREDIKAAVAEAGRTKEWNFRPVYWGHF